MRLYLKLSFIIFFIFFSVRPLSAQRVYSVARDVPVMEGERRLSMPWGGGLNSPILQTADISGNGTEELITFDRTSRGLMVFEHKNNSWKPRPDLVCLLPPAISNWFLMKDYDGDGQKDMFTWTSAGIKVFRNVAAAGNPAAWEEAEAFLKYESNNRDVNLLVNSGDVPAIEDVDGDGDLDIIVYDPSGGGGLHYYRNRSVEINGQPGLSPFVRESERWGGLGECDCGEFSYNNEICKNGGSGHRTMHTGGKSLLLLDVDGDGDLDLLNGFEECDELYYLENKGTSAAPVFDGYEIMLPGSSDRVDMRYPAAFLLEAGASGLTDVVVSSQLSRNSNSGVDFSQSVWLYQGERKGASFVYSLSGKSFLQGEMIDVGESAIPAFIDIDADGDMDMLLGFAGNPEQDGFYGSLRLYENTGTPEDPAFVLAREDFLETGSLRLMQLQPQVIDFNSNGRQDLILTGTDTDTYRQKVFLLLNEAETGAAAAFRLSEMRELTTPLNSQLNPFFYDVNGDGAPDLLAGKFDGSLSLYENTGTAGNPQFGMEIRNYLGFGLDNYRRPLVPSAGDITGNGRPDLILADGTGSIRYLENFLEEGSNAAPEELLFCEGEEGGAAWAGRKSWPVAVRLYGRKAPVVVAGTLGGGLFLLETDAMPGGAPEGELVLKVFPNPALYTEDVRVLTNMPARILLISVTGQVLKELEIAGNAETSIPVANLAAGLYIVQAQFPAEKRSAKLIIVK